MEIPESFKKAFNDHFYNTELKVRAITIATDAEGGQKKVAGEVESTTAGNVAPVSAELQQTMLGQNIEAELKITAPEDIAADKGSLLEIENVVYEVVDLKRYESHAELLAKRWVAP